MVTAAGAAVGAIGEPEVPLPQLAVQRSSTHAKLERVAKRVARARVVIIASPTLPPAFSQLISHTD
jgi:NAD(P)H-dependent FMN reductase